MLRVVAFGATMLLAATHAYCAETQVMVIATIHGLHAKSVGYSYDILYKTVAQYRPDWIGIEIRPEDMADDEAGLARSYPAEMIHYAKDPNAHAFGFDWLGDDIAGAPVPEDWWAKRSPIKTLEREFDQDPRSRDAELAAIRENENAILAQATPSSMNDGRYDALNVRYYERLGALTAGTRFQALSDFYAERDRRLARNVIAAITAHNAARTIILTGADHRAALVRLLRESLGSSIVMVPVAAVVTP